MRLTPVEAVRRRVVTNRAMIGLHIRNVFDAPRPTGGEEASTEGESAISSATTEYGKDGVLKLLRSFHLPDLSLVSPTDTYHHREHQGIVQ